MTNDISMNHEAKDFIDQDSLALREIKPTIDSEIDLRGHNEQELLEAQRDFSDLINLVNSRYEGPASTLANSPEQIKTFEEHNDQVLALCVKRGLEKNLSEQEIKELEVSAILHDIAKADRSVGQKGEIPNYILAAHGELAADQLPVIINNNPEILVKILGDNYSEDEKIKTIETIKNALRCHMGPHPGFMDFILKGVNQKLAEIGAPILEHNKPKPGDKVAEILLAADMCSLADRKGREKVLAIRAAVPNFRKQDEELCFEYKKMGINLSTAEAALLSGFDSAGQARDMIEDLDDQAWINQTIEASKIGDYKYEGQVVNYRQAEEKRQAYLLAKIRTGISQEKAA